MRKYTTNSWFSINRCFKLLVMAGNFDVWKYENVISFLLQMYILDIYSEQKVGGIP